MLSLVGQDPIALDGREYGWLRSACLQRGLTPPPRRCRSRAELLATLDRLPGARAAVLRQRLDPDYEPGESG